MANRSPRKETTKTIMTTIVIGGGWSGLAAAVTLCQAGEQVHLFEAAKQLGGRARNVRWHKLDIDNGQHLMIGAYKQMLAMMQLVDVDIDNAFTRKPIDIRIIDNEFSPLHLSANHWLPWPFSLAKSLIQSIGFGGFLAVTRLQRSIPSLLKQEDSLVSDWLNATHQPHRLTKQLWEPLCLATLNTPINEASAHLLATVIKDSLGQDKPSADLLIPKQPLGDLFPVQAASYIQNNGGEINLQTRVSEVAIENNQVRGVIVNDQMLEADNVVVATAQPATEKLLANLNPISKTQHYPIITVYLQFHASFRLPESIMGFSGTLTQWAFDRSEQQPGLIAIVISGPGSHESLTNQQLTDQILTELLSASIINNTTTIDQLVIREKRATFAAVKGCSESRPNSKTTISGLWLAGDFVKNAYPATLEGAIINGYSCAQQILN
jgi:squalene-associated FAD-dependent desaturase